jgi:hypothetical protein
VRKMAAVLLAYKVFWIEKGEPLFLVLEAVSWPLSIIFLLVRGDHLNVAVGIIQILSSESRTACITKINSTGAMLSPFLTSTVDWKVVLMSSISSWMKTLVYSFLIIQRSGLGMPYLARMVISRSMVSKEREKD